MDGNKTFVLLVNSFFSSSSLSYIGHFTNILLFFFLPTSFQSWKQKIILWKKGVLRIKWRNCCLWLNYFYFLYSYSNECSLVNSLSWFEEKTLSVEWNFSSTWLRSGCCWDHFIFKVDFTDRHGQRTNAGRQGCSLSV